MMMRREATHLIFELCVVASLAEHIDLTYGINPPVPVYHVPAVETDNGNTISEGDPDKVRA